MKFTLRQGRVHLHMTVQRMGGDYAVTLTGGDAHVGAVALGLPPSTASEAGEVSATHEACVAETRANHEASVESLTVPGHCEDELARGTALYMANMLKARVCVACGIHLDKITNDEIALVLTMADRLTHKVVDALADMASLSLPANSTMDNTLYTPRRGVRKVERL